MFCEKCGKELKEEWVKCPYCGQMAVDNGRADEKMQMPQQMASGFPEGGLPAGLPEKNSHKKIWLGIGAGIVAVMAIVAVVLLASRGVGGKQEAYTDLEELIGLPEQELEERKFVYDEDIMTYNFKEGDVSADCSEEEVRLVRIGNSADDTVGIHGVKTGMGVEEADALLTDRYRKLPGGTKLSTYVDYDSRNVLMLYTVEGVITGMDLMNATEEEFQDYRKYQYVDLENLEELIGLPEQELEERGFVYNEEETYYEIDGVYGKIVASCLEGKVCLVGSVGSGKIHGIYLFMELEEAEDILADEYIRSYDEELGVYKYIDYDSRNVLMLGSDEGAITSVFLAHYTEEEFQEMINDANTGEDSGIEDQEEADVHITGNFAEDVANGVLYGKDGKIVDVNGNVIPEYEIYSVIEEGYIYDTEGEYVADDCYVDSTGKVVSRYE